MRNMGNRALDEIISILRNNSDGLTITEIAGKTNLSKSAVRNLLAQFEGGEKLEWQSFTT